VAKLLIFRGDTQLDERQLSEQTVRIGRAPGNDLILEDPGKGVSRNHAEIRFEGGRYTLVDLGSQNGIWVSGTRVPSVTLEPGVSAALGPYRLMIEAPAAVTPAVAVAPISNIDTAPIELTQFSERSAAPLNLDNLVPAPEKQEPAAAPVAKRPAPPAKEPARRERPVKAPPVAKDQPSSMNARIIGGIAVLLLVAVSAFIAYRVMRKPPPPAWDAGVAQALIASGKCQEALDTQINPALQANPGNQQAATLRDECNRTLAQVTSSTTSTVPPSPPTAEEKLNQAEPLLQANVAADCQRALDAINAVLAEDANNQRAKDLAARANTCINPAPVKSGSAQVSVPVDKPAAAVPPSRGGLDIIQGETEKAYKARMDAAKKKYDDAVAVLASQKYTQAWTLFNELMNEVPSGYLELQQRRDEARAGMRAEGKIALTAAEAAENRGDLDTAWDQVRRARQLDPGPQTDAAAQRISNSRTTLGRKKCDEGKVAFLYRDSATAIPALQEAIRLLPANDPCVATAKEYLQKLK
jgi:pSer/pThr/pTyr-binding forkhead associated (FHA) protein/tetratricopeptide (TPR) repeat protein